MGERFPHFESRQDTLGERAGTTLLTDMFLLVGSRGAETFEASLVSFVVAMRKVETRNGQSSINEIFELFHLPASRSKGTHNLGATIGFIRFIKNRLQRNVGTTKLGTRSAKVCITQRHDGYSKKKKKKDPDGVCIW